MRFHQHIGIALAVACLFVCNPAARGQDEPAPPPEPVQRLTAELEQMPAAELQIRLAPLALEELERVAGEAMQRLRAVADELARALVEQAEAHRRGPDVDTGAVDARVEQLLDERSDAVSRADLVLTALKRKGGDVEQQRAYIEAVRVLAPQLPGGDAAIDMTDEERDAAAARQEAASAIAAVREAPPVHEQAQPWAVPIEQLELELSPLTTEQVQERIDQWMRILEREVQERVWIDIALQQAEEAALRDELAQRSAAQQEIVQAIVKRAEAALLVLQARGGEVEQYRTYIATATGQKLNLHDPEVFLAQATAWLQSREGGIKIGLNLLKFLGILVAFFILSRILGAATASAVRRVRHTSALLQNFLAGGVRRLTLLIGLVIAVSALGVNITPLVAAIGAAGLVIGLALQGTLSNFASGILILLYRPYDVGDVINGGGVFGKVESMNLVSTSILTFDNQVMIVPNNEIWNNVITNATGRDTRRVDFVFGIAYSDDVDKATKILEDLLGKHEKVLDDPAPMVRVHEFGDNSVNLIARPWTRTTDYWDLYWDLMRQVKHRFDEEGINIPFPQRDLHVPGTIEVRLAADGSDFTGGNGAPGLRPVEKALASEPGPADDPDGDDEES